MRCYIEQNARLSHYNINFRALPCTRVLHIDIICDTCVVYCRISLMARLFRNVSHLVCNSSKGEAQLSPTTLADFFAFLISRVPLIAKRKDKQTVVSEKKVRKRSHVRRNFNRKEARARALRKSSSSRL